MGALILAGQDLVAGTAAGQLNQYYGFADANPTTVTQAALTNLSSVYTIPAGEAYAGAAYELSCAGHGGWGSTQQSLTLSMLINGAFGVQPAVGAVALSASQAFSWSLVMKLTCADGVNQWWADLLGALVEASTTIIPGTAGQQAIALADANTGAHTAAVSSAITVAIQAKWASTTGAPTITCSKTTFRKIA